SNSTSPTELYTLSLHDALPILGTKALSVDTASTEIAAADMAQVVAPDTTQSQNQTDSVNQTDNVNQTDSVLERLQDRAEEQGDRSEEHTSELQSRSDLVCRLLL